MASTQRRIQQEAEMARRQRNTVSGSNSLPNPPDNPSVDSYNIQTSLSASYGSPMPADNTLGQSDLSLSLSTQPISRFSIPDSSPHPDPYRYFHSNPHQMTSFSYASSIANPIFRPPSSAVGINERKIVMAGSSPVVLSAAVQLEKHGSQSDADASQQTPDSFGTEDAKQIESSLDVDPGALSQQPKVQTADDPQNLLGPDLNQDDVASELFLGFEKVGMDNFDTADNEWLYALETPCARPGAVCECGPSCCCPGCFTHTNNPGDKGVYNAMLNRLGGMLSGDKEDTPNGNSRSCLPTPDRMNKSPEGSCK
jgi:hypothetical protein